MTIEEGRNPQHPEGLTVEKESLILALYDLDAIRFGDYKWAAHDKHPEAPLMPIYTNFRMLQREPEYKSLAVDIYQDTAEGLEFDLIAGIPTAAIPFSSSFSDRIQVGHITPRMDSKTHGSGASVDGMKPEDKGKTALVMDDLVSFFDSKGTAIDILRDVELLVYDVVVLMDYELGAANEAEKYGVRIHSAFTARQMLDFSLRAGKISSDTYAGVQQRFTLAQAYFR